MWVRCRSETWVSHISDSIPQRITKNSDSGWVTHSTTWDPSLFFYSQSQFCQKKMIANPFAITITQLICNQICNLFLQSFLFGREASKSYFWHELRHIWILLLHVEAILNYKPRLLWLRTHARSVELYCAAALGGLHYQEQDWNTIRSLLLDRCNRNWWLQQPNQSQPCLYSEANCSISRKCFFTVHDSIKDDKLLTHIGMLHALGGLVLPKMRECWWCTIHADCYSPSELFISDPEDLHSSSMSQSPPPGC